MGATRKRLETHKVRANGVYLEVPRVAPAPSLRVVPCPDCPAGIGDPCISSNKRELPKVHPSRRRMAFRYHREHPTDAPEKNETPKALGPDEDGVVCPDCGTKVAALKDGRPVAHAPGGRAPNTRKGDYRCESSGRTYRY